MPTGTHNDVGVRIEPAEHATSVATYTATVIIPAFNEADVIGQTLSCLFSDARPNEFEIVLAANGCSDDTVEIAHTTAREYGWQIQVIDLPVPNKALAMRAAEGQAHATPIIYLDADVRCQTRTVRALIGALEHADLAVPSRRLNYTGVGTLARWYYQTWAALPWVENQLTGRGAVAVNDTTRATFEEFPDLSADDRFLTTRVAADRAVIVDEPVEIFPPKKLKHVIQVRTRVYRGNRDERVPSHDVQPHQQRSVLLRRLVRPKTALPTLVFMMVTALAKRAATSADNPAWERAPRHSGDQS